MTTLQDQANTIATSIGAELLLCEPNFSRYHGTIYRYRMETQFGVLYFTITEKSYAAMRWVDGFDREALAKVFDQAVTKTDLRWDLIAGDDEDFLFELEFRLTALKIDNPRSLEKAA